MNGVHCQISWASTAISGWLVSSSGCGALSLPKIFQIPFRTPLIRP